MIWHASDEDRRDGVTHRNLEIKDLHYNTVQPTALER
jgi:hypothetical protein